MHSQSDDRRPEQSKQQEKVGWTCFKPSNSSTLPPYSPSPYTPAYKPTPDRQRKHTYNWAYTRVRITTATVVKQSITITYSECASVFLPYLSGKQIASFLRHMILSSVPFLAPPHISFWDEFRKIITKTHIYHAIVKSTITYAAVNMVFESTNGSKIKFYRNGLLATLSENF